MRVIFIRHGMTKGNEEKRYVGRTDEPLSRRGREQILQKKTDGVYPPAGAVWSSPMRRCLQTAELIYPGRPVRTDRGLRECDFGLFEYRNYVEMAEDPRYQAWVDSNGTLPFPGGEDGEEFRRRSCRTFLHIAENFREDGDEAAAFIVHGGTIMSVLAEFEKPSRGFYGRQIRNGCGLECEFIRKEKQLIVLREF